MKAKMKGIVKGVAGMAIIFVVLAVAGSFISAYFNVGTAKALPTFGSCQQMAAAFETASQQQQGYYRNIGGIGIVVPLMAATTGVDTSKSAAESAAPSYSTTNIQVAGVDEADIVKTDGTYIYTISFSGYYGYYMETGGSSTSSKLIIAKAYPADSAEVLSETELENFQPSEMFIEGDRLLLFGTKYEQFVSADSPYGVSEPYPYNIAVMTVQLWDISDRSNPELVRTVDFEGSYLASRKIGTDVYFVVNSYPRYYPLAEGGNITAEAMQSMIPLYKDSVSSADYEPACGCAEVAYLEPVQAEQFMTIASISMADDSAEVKKEVVVGSGQNVYASQQNLYVAETSWPYWGGIMPLRAGGGISGPTAETEKTVVYKFSLDGGSISYQGKGEAPGYILNQFSMDEYNGYFRIATTAGHISQITSEATSSSGVYVLDSEMKQVGKLEDLAPGEQMHSARFMGNRCYLVTFKKVDPFFVIDMTVPTSPQVLGKLKIPGYSDYLHPYDENHIIGIGKETTEAEEQGRDFAWYQGIKMAVFDVTDVANPVEMHKVVIGDRGTDSEVLSDHKAFLFDREKNLLVLPITLAEIKGDKESMAKWSYGDYVYQGAYVYDLTLENGFQLKGRITHYDSEDAFQKSGYYFGDQGSNVRRSLYIDDVLYTISNSKIKANALSDLSEIKELSFSV